LSRGNDDQTAADLHDGNGDSEERENMAADEKRSNQKKEAVDGNLTRKKHA
jgi:hypothetical protein